MRDLQNVFSLKLTTRQLCDLELLLVEGFKPLTGFLNETDYNQVLSSMHLANGALWPMPITLDVKTQIVDKLVIGQDLCLRDAEFYPIALLKIESIWLPDKQLEAQSVYGTTDVAHPGVDYLLNKTQPVYIGGAVQKIALPRHYDFNELRHTPEEIKQYFKKRAVKNIVGFQTRNPMHRAHQELTLRAAKSHQAKVLLHPVVGLTKSDDIDYITRVRCYQRLLNYYPNNLAHLSLLPLAMRMAGPKEALWHGLIRKNYGCTHFIVGRDHAGPGKDSKGNEFYEPYAAQELFAQYEGELKINMVPFQEMVYIKNKNCYKPINSVKKDEKLLRLSGTEVRRRLHNNEEIPEWFSFPDIIKQLRETYPAKNQQGFTLFFTGLSGAGKSTIANALIIKLRSISNKRISLLDGDIIRDNLSSELGFSKEHRNLNIQRIGFVAGEITKHRGIAICAPIAPYAKMRGQVRESIQQYGGFVEIYIATSLAICEKRDPKQLYKKARAGEIKYFTGIDDPYQPPNNPELLINTEDTMISEAVEQIINFLKKQGYLK